MKEPWNDPILVEGIEYIVGMNDGTIFKNIVYTGTKIMNGKPIMVFQTEDHRQLAVNPSYHGFTLEEPQTEEETVNPDGLIEEEI
jgi:Pyruvate/2-oxoacid:ferredoxin oxidoreductase gamma subunit|tara:strand:- start:2161 stop:2415 length:255 start_codon:yes stop_codon:yes gene_type:complete